ncbi:putative nucleosome assembly protein [Hypsibius exemplaris]|uniref:Nucleosome assembly protein n=1 Tax=Hypsibius exemplaris TaxID=2072580 RepID=A0A1W0WL47_HYPEX|nr:putative nucleosome assembly protein [Hypsibius exemplaris]
MASLTDKMAASAIGSSAPSKNKPAAGRPDAGDLDVSDEVSTSSAASARRESLTDHQKYPENIHHRVNALRHLYMESRRREHELQIANFKKEAETYKSLEKVWKKRLDIVTGAHEPTLEESRFSLDASDAPVQTAPNDGQQGVPKFWLVVLNYAAHTADMIHPQDVAALEFLRDVRVEYSESPLGFTLVFDFLPNPYFSNATLTRSYEYGTAVAPAQLYSSSNLMPKATAGTKIDWKAGKDLTKRVMLSKDAAGSAQKADSFFDFFAPTITDLGQIGQSLARGDDQELLENAEQAGLEYEIAIALRSRIVPRALLFYTGEADTEGVDDSEYSEDYSDTEESETAAGHELKEQDEESGGESGGKM